MSNSVVEVLIYTPSGLVYSGSARSVLAPCSSGELDVMPGHAPMFSYIGMGILILRREKPDYVFIRDGILSVGEKLSVNCSQALPIETTLISTIDELKNTAPEDQKHFYVEMLAIKQRIEQDR